MFKKIKNYLVLRKDEKKHKQEINDFAVEVFKDRKTSVAYVSMYLNYIGKSYCNIGHIARCNDCISFYYDKEYNPNAEAGRRNRQIARSVTLEELKEIWEENPELLVIPKFV